MPNLRDQLHNYAAVLDESSTPARLDEIVGGEPLVAYHRSGTRTRRRWPLAMAACLAVLALIGGVALWSRADDTTDVETSPAASGQTSRMSAAGWTLHPEVFGPGAGASVVESNGDELLAISWTLCTQRCAPPGMTLYGELFSLDVWHSVNGSDWEVIGNFGQTLGSGVHTLVEPRDAPHIRDLTYASGRWIAVGTDALGAPNAWTSADGSEWKPVGSFSSEPGAPGAAFSVAAQDDSVVAVGSVDGSPVIWVSRNGLSFKQFDAPISSPEPSSSPVAYSRAQLGQVVASGGGFVAAGAYQAQTAAKAEDGVIFLQSEDGFDWQPIDTNGTGPSGATYMAVYEGDVVALDSDGVVWRLGGGRWERIAETEGKPDPDLYASALASSAAGLVAIHSAAADDLAGLLTVSPNGVDWSPVAPDQVPIGTMPHDVVAHRGGFVVVGKGASWTWYPE